MASKNKEKISKKKETKPQNKTYTIEESNTHFAIKEAYKTARTNLMFTLAGEKGCKKILVTSAHMGEGKSTSTINLAHSFAQTGARVMIIEADLRRPKLHRYMSLPNEKGTSEYLGGFSKPDEIIQHSQKFNLDCITGGHIPPNPSELLISPAFGELLDALSENYDYIFVDSPPVNVVSDSVSIAKLMSGAVLVIRQNQTTSDALQQTIAALEFGQIKILGYLYTGARDIPGFTKKYTKNKYGYKGYYKYGYVNRRDS